MPLVLLFIFGLVAGCEKNVVKSEDVAIGEGVMRSGSLQLPEDAGVLAEELQVVSVYEEVAPDSAGNFDVAMVESEKPQFVLAMDPDTDNPLLLGYADPIQGGSIDISLESTAVALVFLNPMMIATTAEQRSEFISEIKAHPDFPLLVEDMEARFQADPQNALDFDAHPELYQQAVEIFLDIWQQLDAAGKLLAQDDLSVPWIEDERGDVIAFVNPTMVYYGAGISKDDQLLEVVTAGPKKKYIDLEWEGSCGWKFWECIRFRAAPVFTYHSLTLDGELETYLTKGYQFESFFDWNTPDGRASMLNTGALCLFMLDLIVALPFEIPKTSLKLNQEGKTALKAIRTAYRSGDSRDFVVAFIGFLKSYYKEIIDWLGGKNFKNSEKIFKALSDVAKRSVLVMKVIRGVNVQLPFVVDLITAEPAVRYTFHHEGGEIQELTKNAPPIPALIISPAAGVVDTRFVLDASQSEDAESAELLFRWDWENDGVWDTEWQVQSRAEHKFDEPGSYSIVLQVADEAGSIRSITRKVSVGGGRGTATQIKLFRDALPWNSNAMLALFNDIGFVEGTGTGAYEILSSRDMESVELIPGQDLVVVSNDQPQGFYNNYARNQVKFLNFVDNGGTLFWGASDQGWSVGSIVEAGINLPGGVEVNQQYESENLVFNQVLPLVSGLPEILTGDYASHEWFANLPDGTVIYTIGKNSRRPTLIEFSWGAGWVIMTGQPLEWGYDRRDEFSMGLLLDRVIAYVLGHEGHAAKIAALNPPRSIVDRNRPSSAIR